MLVPISHIQSNGVFRSRNCSIISFKDDNGCTVYTDDIVFIDGAPYIDLVRRYDYDDGFLVYDVQFDNRSIVLTKEQEKLYGLL